MKIINFEGLTISETIKALKEVRKGSWHSFTKKHVESNGYYYVKRYSGRLCDYENMSSTIELRKTQPRKASNNGNNVVVVIPNVLYYYVNTGNYNLSVKTIGDNKKHSTTIYYDNNGNEISREDYELVNPPKKSYGNGGNMFYINVLELVEIK